MSKINYNNRKFRSISNTGSGEVSGETTFVYHQNDQVIWGEYSGGQILKGNILGLVDEMGNLDFAYQHINKKGEIRTGNCKSSPTILEDGRIRLKEKWQWTSGDFSKGESFVEEIV